MKATRGEKKRQKGEIVRNKDVTERDIDGGSGRFSERRELRRRVSVLREGKL